jgi:hypothetical protein
LEDITQKSQMATPFEIEALSINLTSEVGADDALVSVRIVPDGREDNALFLARSK